MKNAAELKLFEKGKIKAIENEESAFHLLKYGFILGAEIQLVFATRNRQTMSYLINNSVFSLRKKNASQVIIEET